MFKFNEDFVIQKLKELLAIDSTTGYFRPIQNYLAKEMEKLNIPSEEVHKGGLIADVGGEGNSLAIIAHGDDKTYIVPMFHNN